MSQDPSEFKSVQFLGYMTGGIKVDDSGQMKFTIAVPSDYMEDAMPLRWLIANPVPINVSLSVWEPYAAEVEG